MSEVVGNVVIQTFSLTACVSTVPMFVDLIPTAARQERLVFILLIHQNLYQALFLEEEFENFKLFAGCILVYLVPSNGRSLYRSQRNILNHVVLDH